MSIATSANTPGIPNIPETAEVIKLIGTCIPNWFPTIFRKKRNNAPMTNLTTPWLISLIGFNGLPIKSSIKIINPRIATTTIGSNSNLPSSHLYYFYVEPVQKRPEKFLFSSLNHKMTLKG